MLGSLGLPELAIICAILLWFPFWIWMLVEAATKERPESQDRLIWVLIVLLGGPIGAAIYLVARRAQRIRELGR